MKTFRQFNEAKDRKFTGWSEWIAEIASDTLGDFLLVKDKHSPDDEILAIDSKYREMYGKWDDKKNSGVVYSKAVKLNVKKQDLEKVNK